MRLVFLSEIWILDGPLKVENGLRVLTLAPTWIKFAEKKEPRLHIGNLQSFRPDISLLKQSSSVMAPHMDMTWITGEAGGCARGPTHQTRKPFYITMPPENPTSRENYASELHQVPASYESGSDLLQTNGLPWSRPPYALSKNTTFLRMKNWGKSDLFQTTWTDSEFYRLCTLQTPDIAETPYLYFKWYTYRRLQLPRVAYGSSSTSNHYYGLFGFLSVLTK